MIPSIDTLVVLLAKVTLLLCLGGAASALARRRGASVRHVIWVMTLAGILVVPFVMLGVPAWRVGVLPPRQVVTSDGPPITPTVPVARTGLAIASRPMAGHIGAPVAVDVQHGIGRALAVLREQAPSRAPLAAWLVAVWLAGVAIGLLRLVIGYVGLRCLRQTAEPLNTGVWPSLLCEERARTGVAQTVSLLASDRVSTPVTWGTRRPVILLPLTAHAWAGAQQRVALQHELAHVARRDNLTQLWANVARVVYWFHPAVWFAGYRVRLEAERACDERVVWLGTSPRDYATQLIELARSARRSGVSGLVSVAMARPSQLEQRLRALLFDRRMIVVLNRDNPRALDQRGAVVTGTLVALLVVLIAILQPVARQSARLDGRPASFLILAAPEPAEPQGAAEPEGVVEPRRAEGQMPRHGSSLALATPALPAVNALISSDPCAPADSNSRGKAITAASKEVIFSGRDLTVSWKIGRCSRKIHVKGRGWRLTEDGKDWAAAGPDGSFVFEEQVEDTRRRLEIVSDTAGVLTRTWTVNDSTRPDDDKAREALAGVLTKVFRQRGSDLSILMNVLNAKGVEWQADALTLSCDDRWRHRSCDIFADGVTGIRDAYAGTWLDTR